MHLPECELQAEIVREFIAIYLSPDLDMLSVARLSINMGKVLRRIPSDTDLRPVLDKTVNLLRTVTMIDGTATWIRIFDSIARFDAWRDEILNLLARWMEERIRNPPKSADRGGLIKCAKMLAPVNAPVLHNLVRFVDAMLAENFAIWSLAVKDLVLRLSESDTFELTDDELDIFCQWTIGIHQNSQGDAQMQVHAYRMYMALVRRRPAFVAAQIEILHGEWTGNDRCRPALAICLLSIYNSVFQGQPLPIGEEILLELIEATGNGSLLELEYALGVIAEFEEARLGLYPAFDFRCLILITRIAALAVWFPPSQDFKVRVRLKDERKLVMGLRLCRAILNANPGFGSELEAYWANDSRIWNYLVRLLGN
jgi:hypothetical protein